MRARHGTLTLGRLCALAWRNLWRSRRRTAITSSTIAIGFALAVVSIGLGDGGHNQMIRNAIRMGEGHLTIQPKGYLAAPSNQLFLEDGEALLTHPPLIHLDARIAPRIFLQALAATAYDSLGVGLQGIEVTRDPYAESLRPRIEAGRWLQEGDARGVVIGRGMADKLKAKVGSKLVLMAGGESGGVESRLGRVRGIFSSGIAQMDGFLIVASLEFARHLLPGYQPARDGAALTRLAIFLDDPDRGAAVKAELSAHPLPSGAVLVDWQEMMPELVNFIILDDFGNYIWLLIMLVVVVFGILNTILMSVLERTREFGLVRALGMRPRQLLALVLVETALMATLSLAAGWVLGGLAHGYFAVYGLDLTWLSPETLITAGVMIDPVLFSELSWTRVVTLTSLVFVTTMMSGLYPAVKAARVSPMAALRT